MVKNPPRKIIFPFSLQIKSRGFERIRLLFNGLSNHFPKTLSNRHT